MKENTEQEELLDKIKTLFPENCTITLSHEKLQKLLTLLFDSIEIQKIPEKNIADVWLNTDEVIEFLGIGKTFLWQLRNEKVFEYSAISRKKILYNKESILKFLDKHAINPKDYNEKSGYTTWISTKEAMTLLNVGTTKLYYLRKEKCSIRYSQPPNHKKIIRYDKNQILEFLKNNIQ